MKRFVLLLGLIFASMIVATLSAEATPSPSEKPFVVLDGSQTQSDCAGRNDVDLRDFDSVEATDGLRWKYEFGASWGTPMLLLVIDFVCTDAVTEEVDMLAQHIQLWTCQPVGRGVSVVDSIVRFTGEGGLKCEGPPVQQVVAEALPHLDVSLPDSISTDNLFAEAIVYPDTGNPNCSSDLPLFANANVAYGLQTTAGDFLQIRIVNRPATLQELVELSSPFKLEQLSHLNSFVTQDAANGLRFTHVVDKMPLPLTSQYITHPFTMSTIETALNIGMSKSGFFCGDVRGLLVDPYVPIITNGGG